MEHNKQVQDLVYKAQDVAIARKKAHANILVAQARQSRDYNKRFCKTTSFTVGDKVKKWNNRRADRKGGKMEQRVRTCLFMVMATVSIDQYLLLSREITVIRTLITRLSRKNSLTSWPSTLKSLTI